MNTRVLAVIGLGLLCGCVTQRTREIPLQPEFRATLQSQAESRARVRCLLLHPPRAERLDLWSADTVDVSDGRRPLPYRFSMRLQDVCDVRTEVSSERAVWSWRTVRTETRRPRCESEAVLDVFLPDGTTNLVVRFLGGPVRLPGYVFAASLAVDTNAASGAAP